ncbi:glycosyltransferase [Francisella philomiragia]|uniref:glycosyltransferase family 2 protein n=1 Tax=Francisella philomiragia TaxID=28110 RepID=UPI000B58DCD9|nr:glycosyltransferase [Francisella philomiragia]MBK2094778.1 glycosyltransferase [Francisella philomiragia]
MRSLNQLDLTIESKNNYFKRPVVSICCTTYNHANYIRQALDGFLMQETNFPFEIIVRDDASTDKTAEIIKEYEKKYPNIIKPIYEKENTYSKGVKPSLVCFNKAMGDYIALCEGDDYWTDPKKLQIQYELLQNNDDINLSFHAHSKLYRDGSLKRSKLQNNSRKYTCYEMITGDFFLAITNTLFFRKSILNKIDIRFFSKSPVGDIWFKIASSIPQGAIYINRDMSVYRVESIGSWTESMSDGDVFIDFVNKLQASINDFDKLWNYKYSKELNIYLNKFIREIIRRVNINHNSKKKYVNKNIKLISLKNKILWLLLYKHEYIVKQIRVIKRKCKGLISIGG